MPRSVERAFADLEAILWEADPVARVFTAVTGAAAELTGHAPAVWTAAPDFAAALIYPEDRGAALAAFDEAIISSERRHVEYRVVTADGRVVWLHNAVQPASGDGEGLRGVMLDVTQQKQAERRLIAQYSVTTALADASSLEAAAPAVIEALCDCLGSPQGELWRVDEAGATIRLASTWCSSFADPGPGAAATDARLGRGEGLPGRVLETGRAAWAGDACAFPVVAGGRVLAAFQLVLRGQREPDADMRSMMEAVGLQVGQFMERREAERALRQSEEQYRALFEAHPNPIWVYDLETLRFLAVNEATVRHYGYDRDELLEMTIADIRPPEDLPALMTAVQRITRGFTHSGPWHHRKKDGSVFEVEINSHTIDFAGRRAEVVLAVDVTERRALEQQLLQAQKMEAIGRLAGGVAHDFNNVALVISGHADLLLERLDDEPALRSAREIQRAAEQASALTAQLLAFSRRQVLRPEQLDLSAVVADVVPMLGRLIGDDVELRASLPEGLGTVKADPAQLKQVVMNLALNARDAMPGGGRLTIETSAIHLDERLAQARLELDPGSYLVLAVTDTGEGMDEATRERVFEPFFTTKEPGKGTGLGLSTVYGVVKQSGGSIWVYSEPGHGTTFKVYLPRHGAAVRAPAPREAESMPRRAAGRVLFVEDHEQVRTLVHMVLEQLGYTVLVASSGGEALARAGGHTDTLDVLITDLIMPGMSGRELADRLRADRPGTRVLFTSGYTQDMLGEGLGPGEAYLQKPYDQAELARALEELLEVGDR